MSYVRIWAHIVFATKYRKPLLAQPIRGKLIVHIFENAIKKDIFLDACNGWTDHIHCLVSIGKTQSIAEIAQLIKGESSFWLNKEGLLDEKFAWQDDYWAVSVSESDLERVRKYIRNQEIHHAKKDFETELSVWTRKFGWK